MGKANWIILTLGLAACVALSVLMRQALVVKQEHDQDPVVREVSEVFGSRLGGKPTFEVEKRKDRTVGVLAFQPRFRVSVKRTATMLGRFVWQQCGDEGRFRSLEVKALGDETHPEQVFEIKQPFLGDLPTRSGAKPGRTAKPGR